MPPPHVASATSAPIQQSSTKRTLPPDIRAQLSQIELEYQQGELTQRGYEVRRSRLLSPIDMSAMTLSEAGSTRNNTSGVCTWRD